ncbi:glycosyltransferase family 2 protein [Chitinibacter tainanensis]|uniref:glycosyltransferase family 2 protein n=1 Tax=Chitinibacter tainanensis TaxID=230667 RepID=UPI0004913868|nr:glycosyltransferase family 2 protein [Chitinibacter tainanensis]
MPTLGIAVITKNAATHLNECLNSVSWANEIVVVDSGSTDCTLDIARNFNARIIETMDWPGFGPQKNKAIEALNTDWILALDSDEIVSPRLAESIRTIITLGAHDVYEINRTSNYCGRWIQHSGWSPDWVARLFKRGTAEYSNDIIHERLIHEAKPGRVVGELYHYSFDDLESVLRKINDYSTAGAEQKYKKGEKSSIAKAIYKGIWAFFRTYFLKLGFLDGQEGLMLAVSNAEGTYYRYLKLALLYKNEN